ncbi:hypothetical protein BMETH_1233_0 [methanotrophic bacterial endosymbiont of Bathymodiolus sp.]|nr:hypothetical protein BMETH_1233_0 [methanotrophic bacterial endosymbiont of Bathymodiolus sp.]
MPLRFCLVRWRRNLVFRLVKMGLSRRRIFSSHGQTSPLVARTFCRHQINHQRYSYPSSMGLQ